MRIANFRGDYSFLSNFHACSVEYQGVVYPSAEHAYQAAKSEDPEYRMRIAMCMTPAEAKRLGRTAKLRPNWDTYKVDIMSGVIWRKFSNPYLREKLLATGNALLVEGNTWHDNFWGICNCPKCGGVGKNNLGLVLMKVRGIMRHGSEFHIYDNKEGLTWVFNQRMKSPKPYRI